MLIQSRIFTFIALFSNFLCLIQVAAAHCSLLSPIYASLPPAPPPEERWESPHPLPHLPVGSSQGDVSAHDMHHLWVGLVTQAPRKSFKSLWVFQPTSLFFSFKRQRTTFFSWEESSVKLTRRKGANSPAFRREEYPKRWGQCLKTTSVATRYGSPTFTCHFSLLTELPHFLIRYISYHWCSTECWHTWQRWNRAPQGNLRMPES